MNEEQGRLEDGELVNDRFEVLYLVGLGELGEVYEVTDRHTSKDGVLKLFVPQVLDKPTVWQRYQEYCGRVRSQGYPLLVSPREFSVHPPTASPFAVGDKVPVPALDQLVATVGNLLPAHFARILKALAPSLDSLHGAGLVHRNLKPSNIFCALQDPNGVKLTDFEVSCVRAKVPPYPGWGATPGWVAPEAIDPAAPSKPEMDVYALGLVGYFAMTGRLPYLRLDPFDPQTFAGELSEELPSASARARELGISLDEKLDGWFARTLAKRPEDRFHSVSEMADALMQQTVVTPPLVTAARQPGTVAAGIIALPAVPSTPPSVQAPPLSTDPGVVVASVQPLVFNADLASRPAPPPAALPGATAPAALAKPQANGPSKTTLVMGVGLLACVAAAGTVLHLAVPSGPRQAASATASAEKAGSQGSPAASEARPTASATPAATSGHVEFSCKPKACASAECDNSDVDATQPIELSPGQHVCVVGAEGFNDKVAFVTVRAGRSLRRDVVLEEKSKEPEPAETKTASTAPTKTVSKSATAASKPEKSAPQTTRSTKPTTKRPSQSTTKPKTKPCGTFIPCK